MEEISVSVTEDETPEPITDNNSGAAEAHADRARDAEEDAKEAATESENAAEESSDAANVSGAAASISAEAATVAVEAAEEVKYTANDLMAAVNALGDRIAAALAPPPVEESDADALISIEEAPPVQEEKAPAPSHWYRKPLVKKIKDGK